MLATYGAALLILFASLFVGRAFFAVLGRRETQWLETSVGLAVLIVACSVLTRIGDDATASLIGCAILVVASVAYLRLGFVDRVSFLIAAPVVLITLLLASLPFIASGHIGIFGVGINNDMAAHLIWADYLQEKTGPEPTGIAIGYPLGPHGLVATISQLFGSEVLYPFLGLLVVLPVMTAMTSLNVLGGLSPLRRIVGAVLVGLAYMAASNLGLAGFKELILGLFLLAYTLILRMLLQETEGRFALLAAMGALLTGMVATYSYPGLAWPAAVTGVWLVAEWFMLRREGKLDEVRAELRESLRQSRGAIVGVLVVAGVLVATQIPRLLDFLDSGIVGAVRTTPSKLRYDVNPFEALGAWPSGEFLYSSSSIGLDAWPLFAALGLIALLVSAAWWLRQGDVTLPAAFIGVGLVYVGTLIEAERYVQAKALVVPASLIMLLILGGLLAQQGGRWRLAVAVPFVVVAAYSSFLALRDAVVAPTDRFDELKELRSTVEGETVLTLTTDRFSDYGLRGAEVLSPAKNAELKVPPQGVQVTKDFRLPVDFDSVTNRTSNLIPFAVTTGAAYQSKPPPGWKLAEETDSYRLWDRTGQAVPPIAIVYEEARPGRVLRCKRKKLAAFLDIGGKAAVVWPRPVIAKRLYWEPTSNLEPGEEASQEIKLPPGTWDLSLQYSSPVTGVEIEAPGLAAALPPGMEGIIPYRPEEGPYWEVGRITSSGGPITVTARAGGISGLQKALGVDATANIGNLTAVATEGVKAQPVASSCYLYVDHIIGAQTPVNTKPDGDG